MNLETLQHVYTQAYQVGTLSLFIGALAIAISWILRLFCTPEKSCKALVTLKRWVYTIAFAGVAGGFAVMLAIYVYRQSHNL